MANKHHTLTFLFVLFFASICLSGCASSHFASGDANAAPKLNASLANEELIAAVHETFPMGIQRSQVDAIARSMHLDLADAAWICRADVKERVQFPVRHNEHDVFVKGWKFAELTKENGPRYAHYLLEHGLRMPEGFSGCMYADFPKRLLSLRFDAGHRLTGVVIGPALGTLSGIVHQSEITVGIEP